MLVSNNINYGKWRLIVALVDITGRHQSLFGTCLVEQCGRTTYKASARLSWHPAGGKCHQQRLKQSHQPQPVFRQLVKPLVASTRGLGRSSTERLCYINCCDEQAIHEQSLAWWDIISMLIIVMISDVTTNSARYTRRNECLSWVSPSIVQTLTSESSL